MIKQRLKPILSLLILISFCSLKSYSQFIITGLVEDPSRNSNPTHKTTNSNLRAQSTSAVIAYSDTLRLPFFEDFSGVVVPIDSIVISTSDNLVKVYSKILNSYPDGTSIFIGFNTIPVALTVADSLNQNQWFIKKNATNQFYICLKASPTTPKKFYSTNITYSNAYWRLVSNSYSTALDSLKWEVGGNTYINNRFPLNPVSYNVATFDGLMSNGVPYSSAPRATGYADVLTSLPINLKALTLADSVYLSFYWQQTGIGEAPDSSDYLELDFKDSKGVWNMIDTINGTSAYMDTFKFKLIKIDSSAYFYKGFQFRFRSHGRLSGPFDVWNLDYIYLDKNRTSDPRVFDMSVGNASVSFLKNYTSMPYNQYFANKANEIGLLRLTTNNISGGIYSGADLQTVCTLTTNVVSPSYSYFYKALSGLHNAASTQLTYKDSCSFPLDSLKNQNFPMKVDAKYYIGINDTASSILHAYNNTYVTSTILWDYYAYDDGTPEAGVAINQAGVKVANKFTTNLPDILTDVDIYFTRSVGPNLDGDHIFLCVWDNNYNLLIKDTIQIQYGGYMRYHLYKPVAIGAADFYVGYLQNFSYSLSIGYDRNYDHSDKMFFNLGGGTSWSAYNLQPGYLKGSMMIRPVFSKQQFLVTPVVEKEEEGLLDIVLYPVPTDNELKIKGRISEIALYDLTGRKLCANTFDPFQEEKSIDVSSVPNGLYITEIKINNTVFVKKILVQHAY